MGESSCLLHGFSYASAIPNEYKQGNPMHVLGESISFGRFTSESLSWEKGSTFSHKKYVEEAERYSQPGSVAQKKAFFEAHYKRIAALKAAALLDQQQNLPLTQQLLLLDHTSNDEVEVEVEVEDIPINVDVDYQVRDDECVEAETSEKSVLDNQETSESKPMLKHDSVDSEEVRSKMSSLKTSILNKSWRAPAPSTPANHFKREFSKRSSPKSLRDLLNLIPTKDKDAANHSLLPFKTPAPASRKNATPLPGNTRMKTPIDSSASASATGRKTPAPRWHILSAVCPKSLSDYRNKLRSPTVSTPFTLRTEERAAKRKQKLEEKFNSTEAQKTQFQKTFKEKAGDELRKLSCSLCFKASPLPEFYKDREPPKNHMKKTSAAQPQSMVLGRSISSKKQGTISMPPPPPPPTHLTNNSVCKNLLHKNAVNQSKHLTRSSHENASPNIQQ